MNQVYRELKSFDFGETMIRELIVKLDNMWGRSTRKLTLRPRKYKQEVNEQYNYLAETLNRGCN